VSRLPRSSPRAPRTATAEPRRLGERLRERRLQKGLELAEVAAKLDVPARSLRAVEWDRLDLLGDREEADRILRRYAAFVGFDDTAAPGRQAAERRFLLRSAAGGLNVLLLGIVAVPLIGAAVYLLGGFGGSGESAARTETGAPARQGMPPPPAPPAPPAAGQPQGAAAPRPRARRKAQRKAPAQGRVRLLVTAALGDSWVEAHAGSPAGPLLFSGTLGSGRTLLLSGERLWLRLGAASNLAFTLNGKPADPDFFGTVEAVVTPQGFEPA
jgi:helix-turn-helix protein/uncharacterized protein DUF4115